MAAAVASVDLLYAALGLAGAGALTRSDGLRLLLGCASAAILLVLGAKTLWTGFRARSGLESQDDVVSARAAFVTAVAATAVNPLTIALWTVSFPAAAPGDAERSVGAGAVLLLGVAVGTAVWYGGFATAVAMARGRLGPRLLAVVDVVTGAGLVAFGGLLAFRAVDER